MATVRPGLDQRSPFSRFGERDPWLLRVALQGDRLMAEGPVASSHFKPLQASQAEGQANSVRFDPSLADLELNSVALQPLLGSVFNNQLIAEQLNSR